YTRTGSLVSRFEVPQDPIDDSLAARVINPEATADADLRDIQWDVSGERLALRLVWSDTFGSGQAGTRFSVVEVDSGAVVKNFWSDPDEGADAGLVSGGDQLQASLDGPQKEGDGEGEGEGGGGDGEGGGEGGGGDGEGGGEGEGGGGEGEGGGGEGGDDPDDDLPPLEPYFGARRFLWVPNNQSLLLYSGRGPATAGFIEEGDRRLPFEEDEDRFEFQTTAPGQIVHFRRLDPDERFNTDWWQLRTLANLTADLRVRRAQDPRVVLLEGTAADANFASYRLDYAPVTSPGDWRPIAPASTRQVVDGPFQPWIAPAEDTWLVRLTVADEAGNERSVIRRVATTVPAGVVDVFLDAEIFSPNGDGVLDSVNLSYRTLGPWQADFQVQDAEGRVLLTRSVTHTSAVDASFRWDGRDGQGQQVPDGVYRLDLEGFLFEVVVDTEAPEVAIEFFEDFSPRFDELPLPPKYVASAAKSSVIERVSAVIERAGVGDEDWRFLDDSFVTFAESPSVLRNIRRVSLEDAVSVRYRVVAEDAAGNRAVAAAPAGPEKVSITLAGDHRVSAADGSLLSIRLPGLNLDQQLNLLASIRLAQPEGLSLPIPIETFLVRFEA
ncbi:MAG: FlgD immunoglobulin-like domain containing protein, partial [Acidobacteriota bacterium]